jgi:hypothetical protein
MASNGISYDGKSITIAGERYTRTQFHARLREIVKTMQSDPKSAYRDSKHPDHQVVKEELTLAYRWLNGEIDQSAEKTLVGAWNETIQESEVAETELQPWQELAQMVKDPASKAAIDRARAGGSLTPEQRALVARHDELLALNNTQARKEQASSGGWMKTSRPHSIPAELHALERIQDPRERTHAIRQLTAEWRDNTKSPYSDAKHPEHRNYVQAMTRLYEAERELGPQPEDPE